MQYVARVLVLTLALGVLAVTLSFYSSQPAVAGPGATSVIVTNTPLPVTGNVNAAVTSLPAVQISGTPSVNANITNGSVTVSGTVGVGSMPPIDGNVTVANSAANPVPTIVADNPPAEPFTWALPVIFPDTGNFSLLVPPITPDGKTVSSAVIEILSGACGGLPVPMSGIAISLAASSPSYNLPFALGPDPTAPVGSQTVRLYVQPGSSITLHPLASETGGGCSVSFFGHYITQ
jgi:hypothetical protein